MTRSYKDKKGVTAALRRAGLIQLPHEIFYLDEAGSKGYSAKITVESPEDSDEVRSRGFVPVVKK